MTKLNHSSKLNGKRVRALRNDGGDEIIGVYNMARNSNMFTINSEGSAFVLLQKNWRLEEIDGTTTKGD